MLFCGRLKRNKNKIIEVDKIYNGSQHFGLELTVVAWSTKRNPMAKPAAKVSVSYMTPAQRHCRFWQAMDIASRKWVVSNW